MTFNDSLWVNALEQHADSLQRSMDSLQTKMDVLQAKNDLFCSVVESANDGVSNQLSATNNFLALIAVIVTIAAIWLGVVIEKRKRQIEIIAETVDGKKKEVESLAKATEDLNNKIHSDISGLYKDLRKEETKALFQRLAKEPLDIDNYKVVEYPTNAYGVVDSDEIIVIYYYGHRDSVVVTKYLEDGTNREIASQERRGYNYGDNFVTYQKNIYSYEFVRSDGRTYGIVDDEVITVTYFYRKTTRTLTVKYLELDTEKKVSEDLIETMDYGTQYQTSRKILDDYDFYRVVGNESGKL